jgi:polyhydroxyalkanoate synthesis repressor PhaR
MIRLIKRYGGASRKLYDTEESRYVSLEELSVWIRAGQELQVIDSTSGEDVTAQTLAQSIYEDHKRGSSLLSGDFLHEVIRRGGEALSQGADRVQAKVDSMVRSSVDRLAHASAAQEDMALLKNRLAELEATLAQLETRTEAPQGTTRTRSNRKATRK